MADKMCRTYFTEELELKDSTIEQTKKRLSEAVTFLQDCLEICESIADDKADVAAKNDMDVDATQPIELSPEDEELIDRVFDEKEPDLQVNEIRDATVRALVEEDKKAQEIRDSLSIAQSQVAAGGDPAVMEEVVNHLNQRGPTSLMNAIMNTMSANAIRTVNEDVGHFVPAGTVMRENAEEIRTRSCMAYTLYEMTNVLGIHKWSRDEVKHIAQKIYYEK